MHATSPRVHTRSFSFATSVGTARVKGLLTAARAALSGFQHEDAIEHCVAALAKSLLSVTDEAAARCLLAEALENLARFPEAIRALAIY